jgi:hypothetical protein
MAATHNHLKLHSHQIATTGGLERPQVTIRGAINRRPLLTAAYRQLHTQG